MWGNYKWIGYNAFRAPHPAPRAPRKAAAMTYPHLPTGPLSPDQPVPPEYDVFCEQCGYSLIGLISTRCPECGKDFDPAALPFARIPWLHRLRLGRIRAYVSTIKMILFTPERFATELCRPVRICAADARSFRRTTVTLACVASLLLVGALFWGTGNLDKILRETRWIRYLLTVVGPALLAATSLWLGLYLATDMPTFIWRGLPGQRQGDLGPLHHYASAPLIIIVLYDLLAIPAAACLPLVSANPMDTAMAIGLIFLVGLSCALLLGVFLLYIPVRFMRIATGCGPGRRWLLGLYLPFHWWLCGSLAVLAWAVSLLVIGSLLESLFSVRF